MGIPDPANEMSQSPLVSGGSFMPDPVQKRTGGGRAGPIVRKEGKDKWLTLADGTAYRGREVRLNRPGSTESIRAFMLDNGRIVEVPQGAFVGSRPPQEGQPEAPKPSANQTPDYRPKHEDAKTSAEKKDPVGTDALPDSAQSGEAPAGGTGAACDSDPQDIVIGTSGEDPGESGAYSRCDHVHLLPILSLSAVLAGRAGVKKVEEPGLIAFELEEPLPVASEVLPEKVLFGDDVGEGTEGDDAEFARADHQHVLLNSDFVDALNSALDFDSSYFDVSVDDQLHVTLKLEALNIPECGGTPEELDGESADGACGAYARAGHKHAVNIVQIMAAAGYIPQTIEYVTGIEVSGNSLVVHKAQVSGFFAEDSGGPTDETIPGTEC